MKRVVLVLALAVGLTSPDTASATCMAPQPEHAQMITPSLTQVPPGGGFVLRGSELVSPTVTLTGPSALSLTGTEVAPHVLRFVLPAGLAAGRYEISASYRTTAAPIGSIDVAPSAPSLAAPITPPAGTLTHTVSRGRYSPDHDVTLTLSAPAPRAIGVVFDWTMTGHHFGSVVWANAQSTEAALGGTGHCGGYPFGVTLPTRGDHVRAAFIDERGQMGPWATLIVR